MQLKITKPRFVRAGAIIALAALATACGGGDDEVRTVTGADYSFQNLPREVDAGTEFTFTNSSTRELHEMVVIRIPDSETRPVADLVRLPESQQEAIFGSAEPAMVLLAPPGGGEMIKAVGDGKLNEKGRYAVVCFIPTGADPQAYLNAPQTGGPPQVAGGPPHAAQGMFGEITVK
jgi:plastocyanin